MTTPTFDNNAFAMLQALLDSWGLSSLSGDVRDMLTAGDSAEVIPIKLRETETYKKRFAGNLQRVKNGLPALSEAEFLATEASLKNVVRRYVGAGEYDSQENIDKWISNDLSPQELNDRLGIYQEDWEQKKNLRIPTYDAAGNQIGWTTVEEAWAANGLTPRDALRSLMDPSITETTLKRQGAVYSLGAAQLQAFGDRSQLNTERLGFLADSGVTKSDAQEGYREIAGREQYEGFLARTAGTSLSLEDQENAALLKDQGAEQKRRKVLATDEARFAENYLGTQSSLMRNTGGQY